MAKAKKRPDTLVLFTGLVGNVDVQFTPEYTAQVIDWPGTGETSRELLGQCRVEVDFYHEDRRGRSETLKLSSYTPEATYNEARRLHFDLRNWQLIKHALQSYGGELSGLAVVKWLVQADTYEMEIVEATVPTPSWGWTGLEHTKREPPQNPYGNPWRSY